MQKVKNSGKSNKRASTVRNIRGNPYLRKKSSSRNAAAGKRLAAGHPAN